MKKKKKIILVIGGLLLCLIIAVCLIAGRGDVIVEPKWYVGVSGAEAPVFTSIDYGKMKEVSIQLGEDTWQGVYLQTALEKLGVKGYASLTLVAADGSEHDVSRQAMTEAQPIIAAKRNGREMQDGNGFTCVWIVSTLGEEGLWIEGLDKIAVNE